MRFRFVSILFVAGMLAVPAAVQAQNLPTVIDPQTAVFGKSASHDVVDGSTPRLTGYKMDIVLVASGEVQATYDLGKPTPDAANNITISDLRTRSASLPAGVYIADIYAYGPGGESSKLRSTNQIGKFTAPSEPTGPFSFK